MWLCQIGPSEMCFPVTNHASTYLQLICNLLERLNIPSFSKGQEKRSSLIGISSLSSPLGVQPSLISPKLCFMFPRDGWMGQSTQKRSCGRHNRKAISPRFECHRAGESIRAISLASLPSREPTLPSLSSRESNGRIMYLPTRSASDFVSQGPDVSAVVDGFPPGLLRRFVPGWILSVLMLWRQLTKKGTSIPGKGGYSSIRHQRSVFRGSQTYGRLVR